MGSVEETQVYTNHGSLGECLGQSIFLCQGPKANDYADVYLSIMRCKLCIRIFHSSLQGETIHALLQRFTRK